MKPNHSTLLYGTAKEVSDLLDLGQSIETEHLIPALINALRRIDILEQQVKHLLESRTTKVY